MRREPLVTALATTIAALPLAYAFAHSELARWWEEQPGSLAALFVIGLVVSIVGALLPSQLRLPRARPTSQIARAVGGGITGILFGIAGGAAGWIAADATLWGLLIWFFLGAFVSSGAQAVLPRRRQHDG